MRIYFIAALCLILGTSNGFAQVSITQLPNATTPLNGTEVLPGVQNGQTVQIPETALGVQGPASSTNNHIATFNGTGGRTIQDSGATIGPYAGATLGQLPGTTTNDAASAGNIGEYISSSIPVGSPVSLTSNNFSNVTSISVTAGDWDISGSIGFVGNAATTVNWMTGSITTTSGTPDGSGGRQSFQVTGGTTVFNIVPSTQFWIGHSRFSFASTTTVYLVAQSGFGTSTNGAFGFISARRVR
jgi:hypothetical protein